MADIIIFYLFMVLEVNPRALGMLDKYSATEPQASQSPPPLTFKPNDFNFPEKVKLHWLVGQIT